MTNTYFLETHQLLLEAIKDYKEGISHPPVLEAFRESLRRLIETKEETNNDNE